ncbi:MAG TPA: hypothetical protein VGL19_03450 [Polyangiaceae bacterium]|jgi:hypothetical protein
MKALVLIVVGGVMALACQRSEPAAPTAASAPPVAAPAAPAATSAAVDPAAAPAVDTSVALNAAAPAAPVAAKAVPTEADYEVQAQSTITPTNAAQVLAAIDKQVGN